jgi:glyoxylase-like metal-dependent hydrolase (beta-lactamase superfamily II)/protein tyrosine phosphatase (PTP) superfamily phosphohydrolase (DUF442 family)
VLHNKDRDLKLIKELGLNLKYLIETHSHFNQFMAAGAIMEENQNVFLVLSNNQYEKIEGDKSRVIPVGDDDVIHFGDYSLRVLETPGHTEDSISLYTLHQKKVFTGDSLMVRTVGRADLETGDPETLYDSIHNKLFHLSKHCKVYPGHTFNGLSVSTIQEEKEFNPLIAKKSKKEFVNFMNNWKLPKPHLYPFALEANARLGIPKPEKITDNIYISPQLTSWSYKHLGKVENVISLRKESEHGYESNEEEIAKKNDLNFQRFPIGFHEFSDEKVNKFGEVLQNLKGKTVICDETGLRARALVLMALVDQVKDINSEIDKIDDSEMKSFVNNWMQSSRIKTH